MEGSLRRLIAWGRGSSDALTADGVPARTILAESADVLPAILDSDLCSHGTLVFSPTPGMPTTVQETTVHETTVIPYEGSLMAAGDELTLDEGFIIEVQGYAATPELTVVGPTFVRITSKRDFHAFLHDADRAHRYGAFPSALVHPMIQLCDLCALGGAHICCGPRSRLLVSATGEVRTTPLGAPLGTVNDDLTSLTTAWATYQRFPGSGCPVCLSQAIPRTALDLAHRHRPWLSRYLHALGALRAAAANGLTDLKVSGFSERLITTLTPDAATDLTLAAADSPLLLFNNRMALLHDPPSKRQFQLGSNAARLIELLLAHADHDAAADAVVRHLRCAPHTAHAALTQVKGHLTNRGIRLPGASDIQGTGPRRRFPRWNGLATDQDAFEDWLNQRAIPTTRILPGIPRPKSG